MNQDDLHFDNYGFLMPHEPIPIDYGLIKCVFVDSFPDSQTRFVLFEQYEAYNQELRNLLQSTKAVQWLGGSFASQKLNPTHIDLVTFVDSSCYDQQEHLFNKLREWRNHRPKFVDGFFVRYYPKGHNLRIRYDFHRIQWLNTFGIRKDRQLKNHLRGFLKITLP